MGNTKDRELISFITYISRLEPVEFSGIVKILCVALADESAKVRPYEDILSDLIDNFCSIGYRQRKQILRLLKNIEKDRAKEKEHINNG